MKSFKKFSIPYFVWLSVLVILPLLLMFILTFFATKGVSFSGAKATLDNYLELRDLTYWEALWNSLVIAFWNGTSKGTGYTVTQAKKMGIQVYIYHYDENGIITGRI